MRAASIKALFLFLLVGFFAGALPASATVLVYRGAGTHLIATDPGYSPTEGAFLIVDTYAGQMTLIYLGTHLKQRRSTLQLDQVALDTTLAHGPGASSVEVVAYASRATPQAGAFTDEAAFFRGPASQVPVSGPIHAPATELHARTLSGVYRRVAQGFAITYYEHNTSFTLDVNDTLNANNGHLNIGQVETIIINYLTTAGYPL